MTETGLTLASLAGALAYLVTAALAFALTQGPWRRAASLARNWRLVALLFLGLAVWRLGLGEIRLQDDVRAWARDHGIYEERHTVQALLTLAMLAGAGALAFWAARRRRPSRAVLALGAAIGLVLFSLVRLVSLHQLDGLLFRVGPVHLNYVIDMGLTGWAAVMAGLEIAAARAGPAVPAGPKAGRRSRSRYGTG